MNKVVLLGTSHPFQRGNSKFASYIEKLVDKYEITCIAEEIDVPKPSSASKLSEVRSITHLIIEPTAQEKDVLGILDLEIFADRLMRDYEFTVWPTDAEQLPSGAFSEYEEATQETYRARENEWWRRIDAKNKWPCLVICGSNHFQPFKEQLIRQNIQVIEAEEFWKN
jgi:hypothetical protein